MLLDTGGETLTISTNLLSTFCICGPCSDNMRSLIFYRQDLSSSTSTPQPLDADSFDLYDHDTGLLGRRQLSYIPIGTSIQTLLRTAVTLNVLNTDLCHDKNKGHPLG